MSSAQQVKIQYNENGVPIFLNMNNPIVARACLNVENQKMFGIPNTITNRSSRRERIREKVKTATVGTQSKK